MGGIGGKESGRCHTRLFDLEVEGPETKSFPNGCIGSRPITLYPFEVYTQDPFENSR